MKFNPLILTSQLLRRRTAAGNQYNVAGCVSDTPAIVRLCAFGYIRNHSTVESHCRLNSNQFLDPGGMDSLVGQLATGNRTQIARLRNRHFNHNTIGLLRPGYDNFGNTRLHDETFLGYIPSIELSLLYVGLL